VFLISTLPAAITAAVKKLYFGDREQQKALYKDWPGACALYPYCDPMCSSCDIPAFNAEAERRARLVKGEVANDD